MSLQKKGSPLSRFPISTRATDEASLRVARVCGERPKFRGEQGSVTARIFGERLKFRRERRIVAVGVHGERGSMEIRIGAHCEKNVREYYGKLEN